MADVLTRAFVAPDRSESENGERPGRRAARIRVSPYRDGWRWIELSLPAGPTRLLLVRRREPEPRAEPCGILMTDDVAAAFRQLKERGVVFSQEPAEVLWAPGETFALFRDGEENTIMIGSP